MSVHLVGGGWAPENFEAVFGQFVAEATARGVAAGRTEPKIAMIAVRDGDGAEHAAQLGRGARRRRADRGQGHGARRTTSSPS